MPEALPPASVQGEPALLIAPVGARVVLNRAEMDAVQVRVAEPPVQRPIHHLGAVPAVLVGLYDGDAQRCGATERGGAVAAIVQVEEADGCRFCGFRFSFFC